MNLQRISEFAEIQEGKRFLFNKTARKTVQITSGSFRPNKPYGQHHFG